MITERDSKQYPGEIACRRAPCAVIAMAERLAHQAAWTRHPTIGSIGVMTNPDECAHPYFSLDAVDDGAGRSSIRKVFCGRCEIIVGYFRADALNAIADGAPREGPRRDHPVTRQRQRTRGLGHGCEPRVHGCR